MNNLSLEDYSFEQNMLDLLDSTEMDYYLNNKSPHTKLPVCIAAAVYRVSAGNTMQCNN